MTARRTARPEGAGGEVRPLQALMGKAYQRADDIQDVSGNTAGGQEMMCGDTFPDVGDVLRCQSMQGKTLAFAH